MLTFQPSAELLGIMDERQEAWKTWDTNVPNSERHDLSFDEVAKMDLSLNSMRVYTIKIRSSVIFRDLLLAMRPIQCWAQSTRSANINRDSLRISSEFSSDLEGDQKIIEMIKRHEAGDPRDKIRDLLTVTVSTQYTVLIDNRVLMSFLRAIKDLNEKLFDLYGTIILNAIDGWKDFAHLNVQPATDFVQIHKIESDGERTEQTGNMIFGHYYVKAALAAQFLRQHYSKIKIGYWNYVPNYFGIRMSQADKINIAYYIDKIAYHHLMKVRSYWTTDWSSDMWGDIVSGYIKNMTLEQFWKFLPNGDGKEDPYYANLYNRVLRKDPGLPCPIMCEWPAMVWEKEKQVGHSLVIQKYKDLCNEGYIKDNPDNEHRKLYIKLGEK